MESNHSEWPYVKKIYIHKTYLYLYSKAMANDKRFFKALRFAHWHVELPITAQLAMVISFR